MQIIELLKLMLPQVVATAASMLRTESVMYLNIALLIPMQPIVLVSFTITFLLELLWLNHTARVNLW